MKLGSHDAGVTMKDDCPELRDKVKRVCNALNLKEHIIIKDRPPVWGPGDMEGHVGLDGKHYVVDLARLFPPESPASTADGRAIFYHLLRPELVKSNPKPLCSDAYSGFSINDPKGEDHTEEVKECCTRLYKEVIPAVARALDAAAAACDETAYTHTESQLQLLDLSLELHSRGVNMRHLGRVKELVKKPAASAQLLLEMVVRVFKNELRQQLREEMGKIKIASEEPYRVLIVNYLNTILHSSGMDEEDKWLAYIADLVERKFKYTLTEQDRSYLLSAHSAERILLQAANKMGLVLSSSLQQALTQNKTGIVIVTKDLQQITAIATSMSILALAEGMVCYHEAQAVMKHDKQGALAMLEQAQQLLSHAVAAGHCDVSILHTYAKSMQLLSEFLMDDHEASIKNLALHYQFEASKIYSELITAPDCAAYLHFEYAHSMAYPFGHECIEQCKLGLEKEPSKLTELVAQWSYNTFKSISSVRDITLVYWLIAMGKAAVELWPDSASAALLQTLAEFTDMRHDVNLYSKLSYIDTLHEIFERALRNDAHVLNEQLKHSFARLKVYNDSYLVMPGVLSLISTHAPQFKQVLAKYTVDLKRINWPYYFADAPVSVIWYNNNANLYASTIDLYPNLQEISDYTRPFLSSMPGLASIKDEVFRALAIHCPQFSRLLRCECPKYWDVGNIHLVKSLVHVELKGVDEAMMKALSNMSWLQRVTISTELVKPEMFVAVIKNNAATLTHLWLHCALLSDDILATIGACVSLRHLRLKNNYVDHDSNDDKIDATNAGFCAMFEALNKRGTLRKLHVRGWTQTRWQWLTTLPKSLRDLCLQDEKYGLRKKQPPSALDATLQAMTNLRCLTLVDLSREYAMPFTNIFSRLERLHAHLRKSVIRELAPAVQLATKLTHLQLLLDPGQILSQEMAEALAHCTALQYLVLEHDTSRSYKNTQIHLDATFLAGLHSLHTLSLHLPANYTSKHSALIQHLPSSLQHLQLPHCRSDPLLIQELVARCPALETFDVPRSRIADSALEHLAGARHLRHVLLTKCPNITHRGLRWLEACKLELLVTKADAELAQFAHTTVYTPSKEEPTPTMVTAVQALFRWPDLGLPH
eukprot:TRINITY_DN2097_c0_g1_i9.p1 TRINITY_DN2097_c0_g1~~TRINITY_DN2097_c0_g1_i9.p1  ORF type:complete len:1105 (-),score=128.16 TRINITY_DN2097_c0_g1_i9:70-3384(-)